MKPSPVRELARRYAGGELSLEEYRKQRRHLIDAVCAGTLEIEYGETEARRPKNMKRRWLIAIPAIVLIVIAIGIGTTLHMRESGRRHTRIVPAVKAAQVSGVQLLHNFADANDWSGASIGSFLQQWQKLSANERQAARNSYLFPRLLAQLHEQIVSQQAMLEIAPDPAAATRHLAQLQQLSDTLNENQN